VKWIVLIVALLALVVSPALAADTVTIKSKTGDVTFNHKVHGEKMDCKTCHGEGTRASYRSAARTRFTSSVRDATRRRRQARPSVSTATKRNEPFRGELLLTSIPLTRWVV
jgi:hypothetical protein